MKVTHTTVVTGTNDPTKQVSKDAWNEDHTIVEDATSRTVTDAEKATWNAKQDALVADTDYLTPGTASSTYESIKGADDLYVTTTEKSTWNAKQEALTADVDYLTPGTASTTYEPKKGADDNYVTDAEKVVIGNTSGTNTGDQDLSAYAQISSLSSGWYVDSHTWSYSSADDPTFVVSVNADMTGVISVGMRVKLTQTTAKYFIVTAVGAYADGATPITLYGGTDYNLADAAITSPCYSTHKAPFGFPLDPTKWTVSLLSDSTDSQTNPTDETWYNLGSLSIDIPIGLWRVRYSLMLRVANSTAVTLYPKVTLSTVNNAKVSDEYTIGSIVQNAIQYRFCALHMFCMELTSKTTHYLLVSSGSGSADALQLIGTVQRIRVECECAYL